MQLYNNFIGIDIGKFNFVVGVHGQKETKEYNNRMQEIKEFSKDYKNNYDSINWNRNKKDTKCHTNTKQDLKK